MRAAAALLILAATAARADGGVALAIDPCVQADASEVDRLVRLAFGTTRDPAATRVDVACAGADVTVAATEPDSGRRLSRPVRLSAAAPAARARLLALAAGELVVAVRTEGAAPPPATVERRWWMGALAGGDISGGGAATSGGGLRLGVDRGWLALALDARATYARRGVSLGDVVVTSAAVSPLVGVTARRGRLSTHAGLGPRLGVARLVGQSQRADALVFTAPWAGMVGVVAAGVDLTTRLSLSVGAEVGQVVSPVRGLVARRPEVGIQGRWAGAFLMIAVTL